mmetsp:Transcript_26/g.64  ORF Transcript_26/g.64 Transcript_26/m.64 type:complete len:96 (+) Transcript_26:224-511(+)
MRRRVHDEDIHTSKIMFYSGFAFLPWIWLINFVQYRAHVKQDDAPEELKYYVRGSLIGFTIFMLAWGIWLAVFYTNLKSSWAQALLLFDPDDTPF